MPATHRKTDRLARCRSIRDAALIVVHQEGWINTSGGSAPVRAKVASVGTLSMAHNNPFLPFPGSRLPYSLDIWSEGRKVFSVCWNHADTELEVVAFKSGPWTDSLLPVRPPPPLSLVPKG